MNSTTETVLKETLLSILTAKLASSQLGPLIRAFRRERNLSQGALALRLNLSTAFISDIENNKRSLSEESIRKLCSFIDKGATKE